MDYHYLDQLYKYEKSPLFDRADELVILSHQLLYFFAHKFNIEFGVIYINKFDYANLHLEEIARYNVTDNNNKLRRFPVGINTISYCFKNRNRIVKGEKGDSLGKISEGVKIRYNFVYIPIHLGDIKLGVVELKAESEFRTEMLDMMETYCFTFARDFLGLKEALQTENT